MDSMIISEPVRKLLDRGVVIASPASVEVDASINPDAIAPGVVIHSGCRLTGHATSIGPGCVLGEEAPVTVMDCQLGERVTLKGGYFESAAFLDKSSMGSAAHVRPGTILEEYASGAHAVGLKQTVLFPFVTAGSLINFCDCLMSGGTSRKNHSEIGSSYVHFNYTPQGDKVTPSILGDVPRGVMINQDPIFLGGQGGIVGPTRIEFGCVIPAGVIQRTDALEERKLLVPPPLPQNGPRTYDMCQYRQIYRIVFNNLVYIGNIRAMQQWYRFVRAESMADDSYLWACYQGVVKNLQLILTERISRLDQLVEKMPLSIRALKNRARNAKEDQELKMQQKFMECWPEIGGRLLTTLDDSIGEQNRNVFLSEWSQLDTVGHHIDAIGMVSAKVRDAGGLWLQAIIEDALKIWAHI